MLDDRVLANYFRIVHLEEALRDLFPVGDRADVVQDRRGLTKVYALLYVLDKLNAPEVHVVVDGSHRLLLVDRLRQEALRSLQLRRSKQKGQVLVIVKAPNAVRASRLKTVLFLDYSHQEEVLLENAVDGGF